MNRTEPALIVDVCTFNCGCMTAHCRTESGTGALAEAEYCPAGLRLAWGLKAQRDLVLGTGFADERYTGRFERLEDLERRLHAHRHDSGVLRRTSRPASLDPRKLVGEVPGRSSTTAIRTA